MVSGHDQRTFIDCPANSCQVFVELTCFDVLMVLLYRLIRSFACSSYGGKWLTSSSRKDFLYTAKQDSPTTSNFRGYTLSPAYTSLRFHFVRDLCYVVKVLDTRSALLNLCKANNYQFDTLIRAKHSSMMVSDVNSASGWRLLLLVCTVRTSHTFEREKQYTAKILIRLQ